MALAGWYDQQTLLEITHGSFLARFNDDQELLHASWFGGDGTTVITEISSIAPYSNGVLSTGHLRKGFNVLSYWPLDDGNGTAWMDDQYNHLGQSTEFTDAFITFFCSEMSVGLAEPNSSQAVRVAIEPDGSIRVIGLPDGRFKFSLVDQSGREILQGSLLTNSGRSNAIGTLRLASGMYVIRVEGHGGFRFVNN